MAKVRLQVSNIVNLGLWEKVCEFHGWDSWIRNEGRISDDEWVEFDDQFEKKDTSDEKYPEYVYEYVLKNLDDTFATKHDVNRMNANEVFECLVTWKLGHSEWADTIQEWIKDVYYIDLKSV